MLTAKEYHELKLLLLMEKCHTHNPEEEPCNATCAALDRAVEIAWEFSENALPQHDLADEECLVAHFDGKQCRRCRRCREWVAPEKADQKCKAPLS